MFYIASFSFEQVSGGRHEEGSFQVLLHAADVNAAVAEAKRYLLELQETRRSELFEGHVTLLLNSMTELNGPLERPALINYVSRESEGGPAASIHCDVVDGEDRIASYGWGPGDVDPDSAGEHTVEPFLELGTDSASSEAVRDKPKAVSILLEEEAALPESEVGEEELFVVRWPNGTASLLKAAALEEVADHVDEIGDPGYCEVTRFRGPLSFTFEPVQQRDADYLAFSASNFEASLECQRELIRAAFPALDGAIDAWEAQESGEDSDGIDAVSWASAVATETSRELRPSDEWIAAIASWWEGMSGDAPDRTAALRQMIGVTIPGEPHPETPAQEALFKAEQQRIMQRVSDALMLKSETVTAPSKATKAEQASRSRTSNKPSKANKRGHGPKKPRRPSKKSKSRSSPKD